MTTARVSEPSWSVRALVICRATVESSSPLAAATARVGASVTALTVTWSWADLEAVLSFSASVLVAVTVRVKSASLLAGGVMVRPLSCAGVKVQLPLALRVPAESLAPVGTPAIEIERDSEPSRSLRAGVILRAMAVSSFPLAAVTVRVGVSATAVTVTLRVALVLARSPFSASVLVAVTCNWKSASLLAGGVILRPFSWAEVRVQEPLPLLVPAESLAPVGTPAMVMERFSEPSVSVSNGLIFNAMAVSSLPLAAVTVRVGVSATAETVTGSEAVVVLVLPLASVAVTDRPRVKSVPLLVGGVMVNPSSCPWERVQVPLPLLMPVESLAPVGTPLMVMVERVSEPSKSVRAVLMLRAMAVSSLPEAASATRVGASATATKSRVALPATLVWPSLTVKEKGMSSALRSWLGVKVQVPSPLLCRLP